MGTEPQLRRVGLLVLAVGLVTTLLPDLSVNAEGHGEGRDLQFGEAISLSVKHIATNELAKEHDDKSSNSLLDLRKGAGLSTNAGESNDKVNSSYTAYSGDERGESFAAWSEEGPKSHDGRVRTVHQGLSSNTNGTYQDGGAGHENNNSTMIWGVVDQDNSQSFGRNSSALDQNYAHHLSGKSESNLRQWNSTNDDGSLAFGDSERARNASSNQFHDDKSDRSRSVVSNKYSDGASLFTDYGSDKNATTVIDGDSYNEDLRQNWANVNTDGSSSIGAVQATMAQNNSAGRGGTADSMAYIWDLHAADGTITAGNNTDVARSTFTTDAANLNRNTSEDLSNYAGDGSISLRKSLSKKLEGKDKSSSDHEGSNSAVWLTENPDGSLKKGMTSSNKSGRASSNSGTLNENNQNNWSNFTAGKVGSLGPSPSAASVIPVGHPGLVGGVPMNKGPHGVELPGRLPTPRPETSKFVKPTLPPKPTVKTLRPVKLF